MAKKRIYEKERHPLKMVLYIIAVFALIACIGYLVYSSRVSKKEYEETVRRAAAGETELSIENHEREPETEKETADKAQKKNTNEKETESDTETDSETVPAMAGIGNTKAGVNKEAAVLVLNGTGRPGVAGYWKKQLENAGYSNVTPASYTGKVEEETVIYAATNNKAEPFKEQFPNATIEIGTIETGVEPADGIPLPEKSDIYIVIGSKDARSE